MTLTCVQRKTEMFVWCVRVCVFCMCLSACTHSHVCVCVRVVLKREVCCTKEWRGPTERRIRLQLDGSERRNMVPHVLRKSSPSVHGDNPSPLHHPLLFPSFLLFLSFSCSRLPPLFTPLVHCWQKQGQSRGDGMNAGPRATLDLVYTHSYTHIDTHWNEKRLSQMFFVFFFGVYVVKVYYLQSHSLTRFTLR